MSSAPEAAPPRTRYLSRPEGRIAYDLQGSGPLVVLVPGMGDLRSTYRFLTPALVAAGYTVATTDLRGQGDSDTSFSSYGDPEAADDLGALLAELDRPAVIVGNSLAGGAGVLVAADHPDRVTGLVLIGAFVRQPRASAFQAAMFTTMMAPLWVTTAWKYYLPSLYAGTKPADFAEHRAAVVRGLKRPGYAKALSNWANQTQHDPVEARLGDVDTPVLVIMGERDPDFADPTAEAEWTRKALRGEMLMVPEAGHYPQSQRPEITSKAIVAFLAKTAPHA